MKENKFWDFIKTLLLVTAATLILAFAVCCYIYAGYGGDSASVFLEGLTVALGIKLGTASLIYGISFLILDFFISRKNIGWATIINSFLLSPCVFLIEWLLKPFFTCSDHIVFKITLLAGGIFFVAVSCVMLIRVNRGKNALDAVAWGLADKTKIPYRFTRIAVDAIMMLAGWLMGGVVGFGTVAAVVLTGPAIQFFNNLYGKMIGEKQEK